MPKSSRATRARTTCNNDELARSVPPTTSKGKPKSRLRMKGETAFNFMKSIVEFLSDHNWGLNAAGLAFYALVSMTPFILLAVALGGLFFDTDLAKAELAAAVGREAGPQVAELVVGFAEGAADVLSVSVASIIGVVVLLWSSTNLFTQVRNALHVMWSLKKTETAGGGVWHAIVDFLRQRGLAALGTLIFGALFIALLASRVILTAVSAKTNELLAVPVWVWDIVDIAVAVTFMTLLVRAVYRVIPDLSPAGWAPWIGALVTACLIVVGRTGVAVYLSVGTVDSAYGAAGTLVVFLGWAYFCAWVFLFGARLTHSLACRWHCWPDAVRTEEGLHRPPEPKVRVAAPAVEKV